MIPAACARGDERARRVPRPPSPVLGVARRVRAKRASSSSSASSRALLIRVARRAGRDVDVAARLPELGALATTRRGAAARAADGVGANAASSRTTTRGVGSIEKRARIGLWSELVTSGHDVYSTTRRRAAATRLIDR